MKVSHVVLKAGKTKEITGHPIAHEMVEGSWHILVSDGPNVTERTPAIGFDTGREIDD